jgi:hypothetical protein
MSRICLVFVNKFLLLAGCLLAVVLFAKSHRDVAHCFLLFSLESE